MTPEDRHRNAVFVARFNVGITEAGYPMEGMWMDRDGHMHSPERRHAPPAAVWQALFLAKKGDRHPCWSCWATANAADPLGPDHVKGRWASDCVTGRRGGCHFPDGPARPPRELLRAS